MNNSSMYNEIMDQYELVQKICAQRWDEARKINLILKKADNIILMGTGASLNACHGAAEAITKYIKKIPHVLEMAQAQDILPTLTAKTVCFLVSQSGSSKETIDVARKVGDSPALSIAVTNNAQSYLAKNSDRMLLLNSGKEISSATKTQTAQALIMCMAAAAGDEDAKKELNKLPELIGKALKDLPEIAEETAEKLKDEKAFYIGALGRMYPTARQAALLIKEKDFILTEGLSISELRHGTVEAVYEGMPVFLIAVNEYVGEAQKHAEYFDDVVGAKVYLIVDDIADIKSSRYEVIKIENLRENAFCNFCPTIFFQMLAEKIARLNGYDIDGFRYLSKVVGKY